MLVAGTWALSSCEKLVCVVDAALCLLAVEEAHHGCARSVLLLAACHHLVHRRHSCSPLHKQTEKAKIACQNLRAATGTWHVLYLTLEQRAAT